MLGWPSQSSFGKHDWDKTGSRVIPAFPDPDTNRACVSLYGDSFIWGDEVDNTHAWSNVLSQLLHCRVANYGVGGYGTDQAYLRFHYHQSDPAPIVILGFSSDDITRNINQLRNVMLPTPQCALKPRFILDPQGQLELVPIPELTEKDYRELNQSPERYLKHEFFSPGGLSGLQRMGFPYTVTVVKVLKPLIEKGLAFEPRYAAFYRPDHPSGALAVTTAILARFQLEAREAGKTPLVVIIPIGPDLAHYRKVHQWFYQPVIDSLERNHVAYLNVGPALLEYLGTRDHHELFNQGGHFNNEGYEVLAKIVFRYLVSKDLITPKKVMQPMDRALAPPLSSARDGGGITPGKNYLRRTSGSRGKLFSRLVQPAVSVQPVKGDDFRESCPSPIQHGR